MHANESLSPNENGSYKNVFAPVSMAVGNTVWINRMTVQEDDPSKNFDMKDSLLNLMFADENTEHINTLKALCQEPYAELKTSSKNEQAFKSER